MSISENFGIHVFSGFSALLIIVEKYMFGYFWDTLYNHR